MTRRPNRNRTVEALVRELDQLARLALDVELAVAARPVDTARFSAALDKLADRARVIRSSRFYEELARRNSLEDFIELAGDAVGQTQWSANA